MIKRRLAALILALSPAMSFATPLVLEPTATVSIPNASIPNARFEIVDAVATDGNYLAMGAAVHGDDPEGAPFTDIAVLVFERQTSGTWAFRQTLLTDRVNIGNETGLALRGNLLAAWAGGRLYVFERTAAGWQSRPVDPQLSIIRVPFTADVEIVGTTIVLGRGGPVAGGCERYEAQAVAKNASGVWVPIGAPATSEPAASEAACLGNDIAATSSFTILPADVLANGTSATYIFPGVPGSWASPQRLPGYRSPVALEDNIAVLSGTEVFQKNTTGSWARTQTLQRPDRLLIAPQAVELRNRRAVVVFGRDASVFNANSNNQFGEAARLVPPGGPERITRVDISGRRVVLNGIDFGKAYIFDLPLSFSQPAQIQETFQSGTAPGWTPIGTSSWSVVATSASRVYRQTSLAGDAGSLRGGTDWTNQSIQADVTPTAFSGSDRWVGLTVRRTNASNSYYITARSSNVLLLRKVVNGSVVTLASVPLQVVTNRTYRLRLEAIGTTIKVFVNGQLVLQKVDSSLTHGQAGLVMFRAAANYDNVVVSPSPQVTIMADAFQFTTAPRWKVLSGTWTTPPTYFQSSTAGDALSITGIASTKDQSVQATVVPRSFAATGDPWVGMFARYQSAGNYYYATVRGSNAISLRKVVGGVVTVLDTASLPVSLGTLYALRLEAIGSQLRVYVNNRHVLEAADATFQTGRYGLATFRAAAEFDDVLVTQP